MWEVGLKLSHHNESSFDSCGFNRSSARSASKSNSLKSSEFESKCTMLDKSATSPSKVTEGFSFVLVVLLRKCFSSGIVGFTDDFSLLKKKFLIRVVNERSCGFTTLEVWIVASAENATDLL